MASAAPAPGLAEAPLHLAPATTAGRPEPTDLVLTTALLRLATRSADTNDLAAAALARFGSFANLLAAPTEELFAMPGFGVHSVAAAKLVHEAALRLARAALQTAPPLADTGALLAYLTAAIARERVEQFRILFLDADRRLLADEAQARGTVNHTPVYPREVARRAIELGAAALVMVHNHPSGDPTPSEADHAMTDQVRQALALFGIEVADHIIVGNGAWTSFRREGWLD